ncbi:hypothetical protein AB834_00725 [PVC group bacterium (ex Bugula neritina AB1)]|nr:hypothetical protein AB834_00725 [PVC group bacterium (ex Bugula neritina AB1)]
MHRFFITIILSIIAIFCSLTQHAQWVQMRRDLLLKQKTLKKMDQKIISLEIKKASLTSLEHIEYIARNELGLIQGEKIQNFVISEKTNHHMSKHKAFNLKEDYFSSAKNYPPLMIFAAASSKLNKKRRA